MLRITALLGLALLGCVERGDEGMYVIKNAAIGDTCVIPGDPTTPNRGHGTISYISPFPYVLTPIIQSRLQSATGSADDGTDDASKTIQLRGADVKLTLKATSVQHTDGTFTDNGSLNTSLGGVSTLFSGVVTPGGSAGARVEIIP